jgi:RNA polymerase sigma-70 factor (ECF subfamily)
MTNDGWASLRQLLVVHYDDLAKRLTRRLGSSDLAAEALQETFVRLSRPGAQGVIQSPVAYLLRTAINIASNRRRTENRYLTASESAAFFEIRDEQPDPARAAEARSDVNKLKQVLAGLPARRRDIFVAVLVDEVPVRDLAARYGVSARFIQMELKEAGEIVRAAMKEKSAVVLRLKRDGLS